MVRCREIVAPDLDQIADLLTRGFPTRPRGLWIHALAVEPQQVVLGEAEAADGCLAFYPAVWSMPVLSMQPGWQLDLPGIGDDRLPAITATPVAGLLAGQLMIHLGVESPFGQRVQIVDQPVGIKDRLGIIVAPQLIEDGVG
jgi:hypothetical protein